jgi:hypothetical protein
MAVRVGKCAWLGHDGRLNVQRPTLNVQLSIGQRLHGGGVKGLEWTQDRGLETIVGIACRSFDYAQDKPCAETCGKSAALLDGV